MKLSELRLLSGRYELEHRDGYRAGMHEFLNVLGLDTDNLYQEIEMDSLYVNAHEDLSKQADEVQLHSHNFYEIIFCQSGNIQYCLGTQRYRVHKGDIVIVPPGMSHQPLFPEELTEPYRRYVVWVSHMFAGRLREMMTQPFGLKMDTYLLRTAGTEWERIEGIFRCCCREDQLKRPGSEVMLCGYGAQLAVMIGRALMSVPPVMQEKTELIDEITGYIERHLGEKITLAQTAHRFLVSESQISHLFLKKLGVSFYQWVIKRRLIAAKNLIQEGRLFEDISQEVGFGDYTTFYRAFKKEYGISPSQYRGIIS